jgi:peptide/nickel transport system ATP-binding protein
LLFLTHNLPLARGIADGVAVMHAGTICEDGSVNDVLQAPKDRCPAQLHADAPKMTAAVAG